MEPILSLTMIACFRMEPVHSPITSLTVSFTFPYITKLDLAVTLP